MSDDTPVDLTTRILQQIQKDVSSGFAGLRQDIAGIHQDLSGIHEELSGVHGELSGIHGDISGIRGDISDLKKGQKQHTEILVNVARSLEVLPDFYRQHRELEARVSRLEEHIGR